MSQTHSRPADSYSPLYFLASLGAGGLAASFFMFLLFWVPHTGKPVATFDDIALIFGSSSVLLQTAIIISMAAIAILSYLNFSYLIWNLKALSAFKKTPAYTALRNSNGETTLMAMPLALAMSLNVSFIIGLVFVPGLWNVIEYLFPLAMIGFGLIGWMALRSIGDFLGRVLFEGGNFDLKANNSFAQLLPAFALSMIGVGFAAPAAMSQNSVIVGISLIASSFFAVSAIIFIIVGGIIGFNSMLQNGTAKESSPTIMVFIPLMTVLAILFLRQNHGLSTTFGAAHDEAHTLALLTQLLAVQVVFLLLGLLVLNRHGYFKDFIFGSKTSPGSYALVCPGVALSVMVHFFLNKGLVANNIVDKFSLVYWVIAAVAIALQIGMFALVLRLNKQHFGKPVETNAVPAE